MATIVTAKSIDTSSVVLSKPITAVAAAQTQTTASNLVQNQGTAGSNPSSGNPPQGFAGPTPSLPAPSKPSADSLAPSTPANKAATINQTLGLVDQNTAVQTLAGIGTGTSATQSERDRLTDLQGATGKTNQPAFDQGFPSKPAGLASNPVASRPTTGATSQPGSTGESGNSITSVGSGGSKGSPDSVNTSGGSAAVFNPMDQFKGGSVGGPLGAAAASGTKTLADLDKTGMIAGEWVGGTYLYDHKDVSEVLLKSAESAGALAGILAVTPLAEVGAVVGAGAGVMAIASAAIDAYYYKEDTQKKLEATPGGGAGMPDPENTGSNVNITTQTLLDQLNAAKAGKPASQGGGGDVTPATNSGIDAVTRDGSIAANQSSLQGRNLFGQPVNPALDNVSGGNKGLNGFSGSNGAGVINPGNEAGSPVGDSRFQQDPAKALGGNTPAPAGPSLPTAQSSPSEQSSSVSTTLAAGVRNLTLTGTATINGSGNALDNQITGNGAANELRGLDGNDSLTGQGGNDLLDGGSGRDLLSGGTGADRFRFSGSGGFGTSQADRITDFNRSEGDRIEISRSGFGLAADAVLSFQVVRTEADLNQALSSSSLLIQDLRDGSLLFNQNGIAAGMGQGGLFGQVQQALTLQGSDFSLIA